MEPVEVLRAARELISVPERWNWNGCYALDKHGRGVDVKSPEAVRWCALGAIARFSNEDLMGLAPLYLYRALPDSETVVMLNDDVRNHGEIVALFDRAIALADPCAGLPGQADREITVIPAPDEQPLVDPDHEIHAPVESPVPVEEPVPA